MTDGSNKDDKSDTALDEQATGDGQQAIARKQGTGNRQQATGNRSEPGGKEQATRNAEPSAERAADLVRVTAAQRRAPWTPMRVVSSIATVVAVFVGVRLARHWFSHDSAKPAVTAPAPSSGLQGVPDEAWNDPLAKLFDAVEARDAAACAREEAVVATVALSPRDRLRGQMLHARCEMLNGTCGVAVARMRIALAGVGSDTDTAVLNELATYCR